MAAKLAGFGDVTELFPETGAQAEYIAQLRDMLGECAAQTRLFSESYIDEAAEYLFHELTDGQSFAVICAINDLHDKLESIILRKINGQRNLFFNRLRATHRQHRRNSRLNTCT